MRKGNKLIPVEAFELDESIDLSEPEEVVEVADPDGIDLDFILSDARKSFDKNEKDLAMQLSTGANMRKFTDDKDYVLYPGAHWAALTGIRGVPFGRVIQIAGKPDSGKSSHAMSFMKSAQDSGHVVILWDAENKFSANRFDNYFKGSSSKLLLVNSRVIIHGGDMTATLVRSILTKYPKKKVFIVWDSVGGSLSTAEHDRHLRDSRQMAIAAKENGQVLHAWVNLMEEFRDKETGEEKIAVLLINQTYANIGSVGQKESGGQKVEYHSSLIVTLTRKGDLTKVKDKVKRKIGICTIARAKKNHLFDGVDCVAQLDLKVTAGAIALADEKLKEDEDGFEDPEEE